MHAASQQQEGWARRYRHPGAHDDPRPALLLQPPLSAPQPPRHRAARGCVPPADGGWKGGI